MIHIRYILPLLLIFLTACTTVNTKEPVPDPIVCNDPYIRFEDGCCLDKNTNDICDDDEVNPVKEIQESLKAKKANGDTDNLSPAEEEYINDLESRMVKGQLTEGEKQFVRELEEIEYGNMDPSTFLPEKCMMPSGIACLDFIYDNILTIRLQNAAGFDMENVTLTFQSDQCEASDTVTTFRNGEMQNFEFACTLEGRVKATLEFEYINSVTRLKHLKKGEMYIKAD